MNKKALSLLSLILMSGCVSSHTDFIDDRTAMISGRGTAFDNASSVKPHILIKASELAVSKGFKYFQVIDDMQGTDHSYLVQNGPSYTHGTLSAYGNTARYNQTTTNSPSSINEIDKPKEETTVRFYKDGEINPDQNGVWDAQRILAANQK